jgi:hypothetical protein
MQEGRRMLRFLIVKERREVQNSADEAEFQNPNPRSSLAVME